MSLIRDKLTDIRARLAATTPGKWRWQDQQITGEIVAGAYDGLYAMNEAETVGSAVIHADNGFGVPDAVIRCAPADAEFIAHAHGDIGYLTTVVSQLLEWIDDLHSGMYVNCVYCGHRYGPGETTPVSMADALKAHVEQCPEHPMSRLKGERDELQLRYNETQRVIREAFTALDDIKDDSADARLARNLLLSRIDKQP